MLNLHVLDDLVVSGLTDIEKLASQGKDAVVVPSDDTETGNGQCFGRVSFSENEGAPLGVATASVIGVLKLNDAGDTDVRDDTFPKPTGTASSRPTSS